jgi:hypothetical protein
VPPPPVEEWPLLLAGPIVRRVEPERVAVWVAVKEPRAVRLSIFDAPVDTGPGDTMFGDPSPLMAGVIRTIRVGEHLHIAVVQAGSEDPLLPGRIYAYNVAFGDAERATFQATADLRSLGLLRDRRPSPPPPEGQPRPPFVPPHLALGYEPGLLPTFVMPAAELTGLRVVHGSCRRPHARVPDLMPTLDDQIEAARISATDRPQQLFLTGDQIYADDVAPALLHVCTAVGHDLLGSVEHLPISWAPPGQTAGVRQMPADSTHFPAGVRKAVVTHDARFTTSDGDSHLLSLGEFCAMHLLCWSNVLWGEDLPSFDELFWRGPLPPVPFDEVLAGLELPPPIWQLHTGLYEKSTLGLKSRCEETRDLQTFTALNVSRVLQCAIDPTKSEKAKDLRDAYERHVKKGTGELSAFRDALPKVRRALANVATYMIFDDHEVTDDWNLSQIWRDRVFTSPLGRTILRNGLLGYFLCQGWGNDPLAFEADIDRPGAAPEPSPRKQLLFAVPRVFPPGGGPAPDPATAAAIDGLLGLDGSDPPVQWHYAIDGPRHRALVLDNRTRRAFASRVSPPTNLSPSALREQIPDLAESPLPSGIEVLFVIAPLPIFGVPLFDELGGPIAYRAYDVRHHSAIGGLPGTNPDAAEAWSSVPTALEELLARLAPYRRVVVLSGDVHYAHSAEVSYWSRGEDRPARFAQFTSSALKNVWPDPVVILNRGFAFSEDLFSLFSPLVRLGWFGHEPTPIALPGDRRALPGVGDALVRSPLLLRGTGWPAGTTVTRDPDWAWALTLSRDTRPRSALPGAAKPAPLDPANPAADAPPTLDGYRQAARRHAQQLEKVTHTRRLLFASSFGVVTFTRGDEGITARHDHISKPAGASAPAAFTRHTVALDVPPQPMPSIEVEE